MSFETVVDILQIIFADIILSGDNALVIGMAAAGLAPEFRRRAIMIGMMMAAGMRIVFAVIASFLISIKGILLLGGVLPEPTIFCLQRGRRTIQVAFLCISS
jgi:predicted tellurium resistance membrane protein TerC